MAREEADREDLLREATALVERIEFRLPHESESVVVGFRPNGAMSVFFGADPVYQFNATGELRRAFVDGKLVKAEHGRLVELTRKRTPEATQLVRRDLDDVATTALLAAMVARLARLQDALSAAYEVVGQVPETADVATRVRRELPRLGSPPRIADTPRVE